MFFNLYGAIITFDGDVRFSVWISGNLESKCTVYDILGLGVFDNQMCYSRFFFATFSTVLYTFVVYFVGSLL